MTENNNPVLMELSVMWNSKWLNRTSQLLYPYDWIEDREARALANIATVFECAAKGYPFILFQEPVEPAEVFPCAGCFSDAGECPSFPCWEP